MSRQMRGALFISLVIAVLPCSLRAQERFPEAPYGATKSEIVDALKNCKDAIREDIIQICAWDAYRREDAKYRAAAKQAGQALVADQENKKLLVQANRAFEQFRKATCAFDSNVRGSMAGSLLYGCLELYTRRRAEALKVYADCEKSGNCGLPNLLYIPENENKSRLRRK